MRTENELKEESECPSISLYVSSQLVDDIDKHTNNRSLYIQSLIEDFLQFLERYHIINKNHTSKRKIITVSKPREQFLDSMYNLIKTYNICFSRSELVRFILFFNLIIDTLKNGKLEPETKIVENDPNIIKISNGKDAKGNKTFDIYKVLRKLEF